MGLMPERTLPVRLEVEPTTELGIIEEDIEEKALWLGSSVRRGT